MHWLPLPIGDISGTHFCTMLGQPLGHNAAEWIKSMKYSNGPLLVIKSATFWLIVQYLNQMHHCIPCDKKFELTK